MLSRTHELMEGLLNADGAAWIRRLLQNAGTTEPHPWVQANLEQARTISAAAFTGLLEEVDGFRSAMHTFMQNYDVILCPTSAFTALPHGSGQDEKVRKGRKLLRNLQHHRVARSRGARRDLRRETAYRRSGCGLPLAGRRGARCGSVPGDRPGGLATPTGIGES